MGVLFSGGAEVKSEAILETRAAAELVSSSLQMSLICCCCHQHDGLLWSSIANHVRPRGTDGGKLQGRWNIDERAEVQDWETAKPDLEVLDETRTQGLKLFMKVTC